MGGRGSGGANAISIAEHLARGSYRPARHSGRVDPPPAAPVTAADRRRTLEGLTPEGRRMASAILDAYDGWSAASLFTLRQYVESCVRLQGITDDADRRREQRANLQLLRALELER
jgi:hypothetical protein